MDVDIISPKLLLKDFFKSIEGYKGLFFVVPIAIGIVTVSYTHLVGYVVTDGYEGSSVNLERLDAANHDLSS